MKFCHVLMATHIPDHIKACLEEQPHRSGMYNWIFALRGNIEPFRKVKDHLDDYDVIQVNMSPKDMPMIQELRKLLYGSSTKLVLNNDYVCEYWGRFGLDPYYYQQVQKMGDMVFSTEPHQVSNMIDGTFLIPHPTNTQVLKHLGTMKCSNSAAFIYHWWCGQTLLPALVMDKVKKLYGLDKTKIYNYQDGDKDAEMRNWNSAMFDEIVPPMPFPDMAEAIQGERIVYDPTPYHTYGRNGVELACFKRPVIGSNRVMSYNMLFPELTCDPFDKRDTLAKFDIAMKDNEKTQKILDEAYQKVEFFNYENSVKRFKEALDVAVDRGGHVWYMKNG